MLADVPREILASQVNGRMPAAPEQHRENRWKGWPSLGSRPWVTASPPSLCCPRTMNEARDCLPRTVARGTNGLPDTTVPPPCSKATASFSCERIEMSNSDPKSATFVGVRQTGVIDAEENYFLPGADYWKTRRSLEDAGFEIVTAELEALDQQEGRRRATVAVMQIQGPPRSGGYTRVTGGALKYHLPDRDRDQTKAALEEVGFLRVDSVLSLVDHQ